MKVLVIEYLAPRGHVGYDSFHIKSLATVCEDYKFVSSQNFINECGVNKEKSYALPKWLFPNYNSILKPILERIFGIFRLLFILLKINIKHYDVIVFLSYDIMSLFVFRVGNRVLLCNHNNTTDFFSNIKKRLHNSLPSNYEYVVLADFIQDIFKNNNPTHKVHVIPHGLTKQHKCTSIKSPFGENNYIFCSTTSSCDKDFLYRILNSSSVEKFLTENNIDVVIKAKQNVECKMHVKTIIDYIDDKTYSSMIKNAVAVFAPYSEESFKNRVSAVLMECIASNIPIICTNILPFSEFRRYANYNFIVNNENEFISCLKDILIISDNKFYKDINSLYPTPYWHKVLSL